MEASFIKLFGKNYEKFLAVILIESYCFKLEFFGVQVQRRSYCYTDCFTAARGYKMSFMWLKVGFN